jgi:hypothetical protein
MILQLELKLSSDMQLSIYSEAGILPNFMLAAVSSSSSDNTQ